MFAVEVAQFLSARGFGTLEMQGFTGSIFFEVQPAQPDKCITLYTRGGDPSKGNPHDYPALQIITRGGDPQEAYDMALGIIQALESWHDAPLVSGGRYVVRCDAAASEPTALGPDQNGRQEYGITLSFMTMG